MASKSKRRRRVLGASCILAALIVGASSFAWFTSSDEVTNRLTASADYGVTIAEDFTPPENWLPGQKVDKNVGVVNTGNVDAFVRTWLEGEMKVLAEVRNKATWNTSDGKFADGTTDVLLKSSEVDGTAISTLTAETDASLKNYNLNYHYGSNTDKVSLKELSTKTYQNPNPANAATTTPDAYSEVMSVQAGGKLVYANTATGTTFYITPNQSLSFKSEKGVTYNVLAAQEYKVVVGTVADSDDIAVDNTATPNKTITVKDAASLYKYVGDHIDTDSFKPASTGLYIFKRNADMSDSTASASITEDVEFSGYYYVAKKDADTGAQGKFFALQYVDNDALASADQLRSDYVLPSEAYTYTDTTANGGTANDGVFEFAPTTSLALYTANQHVIDDSDLVWSYSSGAAANGSEIEDDGVVYTFDGTDWKDPSGTAATGALKTKLEAAGANLAQLTATYKGAKDQTDGKTYDDIKVQINLNNVNSAANSTNKEKWTAITPSDATTQRYTFYYNNDVEEGSTTAKLVDSVELSKDTKKGAYIAFDFDLKVKMDSIQVTINDDGKEAYETATTTNWATTGTKAVAANGAAGTYGTNDTNEIETIVWTTS